MHLSGNHAKLLGFAWRKSYLVGAVFGSFGSVIMTFVSFLFMVVTFVFVIVAFVFVVMALMLVIVTFMIVRLFRFVTVVVFAMAVVAIAVNPDEGKTMVINVVDIGNGDPTPDDIMEAGKEEAAPDGVEAVSTEVETCDFLGEESACLRFHGIQDGNDVYQQHRVYIKDGYYIQICMSSYNKDETDDMFAAVSKIEE